MFLNNLLKNLPDHPHFNPFLHTDINPLSGFKKERRLYAPNEAMRVLHRRFLLWLHARYVPLPNALGARRKCSPRRNVLRHRMNRYFYTLDITNAYKHVYGEPLAMLLCGLDSRLHNSQAEMREFLQSYFLLQDDSGLITGAPASPSLYNHYAGVLLDKPLNELCIQYKLTYTRYLDDITISSPQPIGKRKRKAIRQLIQTAGFPINPAKSRYMDLRKKPIVITGVGLRWQGILFLPRHYLRKILGLLHTATLTTKVSPNVVNGAMGVFWAVTNRSFLNEIERRVIEKYQLYYKNSIR